MASSRLFGVLRPGNRKRKRYANLAMHWLNGIRAAEHRATSLSDQQLRNSSEQCRECAANNPDSDDALIEYAGLVAEAVYRTNGFRLHDVQVKAISAGVGGAIVEMQTGEGKTIVTGAIAAVQTLKFPSVHVGTTNTYLAARDLEGLAPTFELLGITFGLLPETHNKSASRRIYRKQVVYGPGYQFGFDYLIDQMYLRANRQSSLGMAMANRIGGDDPYRNLMQAPEHHLAIIDEADSVMIDEAMTPLVISVPGTEQEEPAPYLLAKKTANEFTEGEEFTISTPARILQVTDQANRVAVDAIAHIKKLALARPWRIYIANAIRAKHIFKRDVDYVVVDEKVQMVDQYTGRIQPDRRWQDGLHQAIEAKENVPIEASRESTTQISRQRYLQMYDSLAGLTGTASSVAQEFKTVYKCGVVPIPTNKPCLRALAPARFFVSLDAKLAAIADEIQRRHSTGQPILVGTRTIEESHQINEVLLSRGIQPTVLNGVQDEEEHNIVLRAGHAGAITIATNMAGRGTDIKPDAKAFESGGLHVIGLSPNYSQRIDRQLVGRAARQGKPGSAQFFVSASDAIFVENESPIAKQIIRHANADGESKNFSRELGALQTAIENRNFKMRKELILRDRWMDTVREAVERD